MIFLFNKYLNFNFIVISFPCRAILSLLTSFFTILCVTPYFIKYLTHTKKYQIIRKDGPIEHMIKNQTPTMGGLLIILSITLSTFLYCHLSDICIWYVISILIGYGLIGFIDDYKKMRYKNSKGLKLIWKYFWLSFIAMGIICIMYCNNKNIFFSQLIVPFYSKKYFEINYLYIFLFYFVIVGASNAVNLTDGLDGLAIMPVVFVTCGFLLISVLSKNIYSFHSLNISYLKNFSELTILCTTIIGSGLGFLWFNAYPAKIFMGDVGSLSLGGALGVISILLHQELLLIIMGGIFVFETVSVILQIIFFKIQKKRIFKMAPIHHHYELKGLSEPLITIRFWIISLILVLIGLLSLKVS